jgi:Zn-dependent protease
MSLSIKLGRVAGIDLYLHATFLLLLAFIGLSQGGIEAVLLVSAVFGCVLLHEFGHALTARAFGIGTEDITLYPIGGVARLQRMPRAPIAELLITLAGPAVNVAIAAVIAAGLLLVGGLDFETLGTPGGWTQDFALNLMFVNLFLALFNLVPAFPMDGGRIFRALLSGWLGRLRATEIAATVGRALAIAFGIYSLASADLIRVALAVFIYSAAGQELARVRMEEAWRNYKTRGFAQAPPESGIWDAPPGYHWVSRGQGVWQLAPIFVSANDPPSSRPWS